MSTGGRQLSYLPSAHIADRWLTHYNAGIVHGATIYSVADPRQVVAALPEARPTVWGAVPRIWEKIKAALEAQGVTDPSALPAEAKAGIHAKLGLDQVEWLISGAAPIPAEVLEYFLALGHADLRALGHVGAVLLRDDQPARRHPHRHRRQGAARRRAEAARGRRAAGARPDRDEGLPQAARQDRGGGRLRRLDAHRRHRRRSTTTAT